MRRFIYTIVILIFSVWLGLKISQDPGLALFSYKDWSVEMPLWFAVVVLLVAMLVLYSVVRFLDRIDISFYRLKNWLQLRRKHKAYSKTNRGLMELIEGHWRNAESYLLEGISQSDAPLINYLAAAKAAHEQQEYAQRDMYLQKAYDLSPHADVAIGLTQAQMQYEQGQYSQALATLNHLRVIAPRHPAILKLLEKLYIHLSDWQELIKLIPNLRRAKVLSNENADNLELKVYLELLRATAINTTDLHIIQNCWHKIPRNIQRNPPLIECYARLVLRFPEAVDEVDELINKALKRNWDSHLVKLYGMFTTSNPKKQLLHAEKWRRSYPNQPILYLTLGRLCIQCQLWGKARDYLEESIKLTPSPEAYYEYGRLFEHLDDMPAALQSYREGLASLP